MKDVRCHSFYRFFIWTSSLRCCVQQTKNMPLIEELLGFFLVANDETRKNVNGLIKEAISSTIKLNDEKLVIGLLEFLQTDKKITRTTTVV